MNILRIKSAIYRYTGIYLANKEESAYANSEEFNKYLNEMLILPDNDMSHRAIKGLLIGMWQSDGGFCRPYVTPLDYEYPKWFWKLIQEIRIVFRVIKWDFRSLIDKLKSI